MRLLLDSHTFVWYELGHPKLSLKARRAIDDADAEVFFSAVTAWEIAIKVRAGRWTEGAGLLESLDETLTSHRYRQLPVGIDHARLAGLLPGAHKDPFDRMLAAQAIVEDMALVTTDAALRTLGPKLFW